jgi:hypothetical protein
MSMLRLLAVAVEPRWYRASPLKRNTVPAFQAFAATVLALPTALSCDDEFDSCVVLALP